MTGLKSFGVWPSFLELSLVWHPAGQPSLQPARLLLQKWLWQGGYPRPSCVNYSSVTVCSQPPPFLAAREQAGTQLGTNPGVMRMQNSHCVQVQCIQLFWKVLHLPLQLCTCSPADFPSLSPIWPVLPSPQTLLLLPWRGAEPHCGSWHSLMGLLPNLLSFHWWHWE